MTGTRATILVVDDEPHIVRVASLKLLGAGFTVIKAHDGKTAWELLGEHDIDLVITDYQMPHYTGIELAEKMYGHNRLRDVPVVLLTARSFSLDDADLERTHVVLLMSKPFSPRELLDVVKDELKRHSLESAVT